MSAETPKGAGYVRVSTDKQEREGTSLEDQKRWVRETAETDGYDLTEVYVDVLSGDDPERPEFHRMLADGAAGKFQRLYIRFLDRFGRDVVETRLSLKLLEDAGIQVVAQRGEIDHTSPEGRMFTTIESAFAEYEKAKIKIRTKAGIHAKGKVKPWGTAGYGYRKTEDGWWELDAAEADTYKQMVRWRLGDDGPALSHNAIAKRLNKAGVKGRFGGTWYSTTVRNILESRHPLGYFKAVGGEWVRGKHCPLITQDRWDAIQALSGRDAKYTPSRSGRRPKRRHLFINGHLLCSCCLTPMWSREDYYVCRNHRVGEGYCSVGIHKRADVDARFLALFERNFLDYEATRDRVAGELSRNLRETEAQIARTEGEKTRVTAERQQLDDDYFARKLSAESYERLYARKTKELAAIDAELDQLKARARKLRETEANLDAETETLRRLSALRDTVARESRDAADQDDLETLRGVIQATFENVFLGPDGHIAGMTPGARMEAAGHAIPLSVGGPDDTVCPPPDSDIPWDVGEDGMAIVEYPRHPIPFSARAETPVDAGDQSNRSLD